MLLLPDQLLCLAKRPERHQCRRRGCLNSMGWQHKGLEGAVSEQAVTSAVAPNLAAARPIPSATQVQKSDPACLKAHAGCVAEGVWHLLHTSTMVLGARRRNGRLPRTSVTVGARQRGPVCCRARSRRSRGLHRTAALSEQGKACSAHHRCPLQACTVQYRELPTRESRLSR